MRLCLAQPKNVRKLKICFCSITSKEDKKNLAKKTQKALYITLLEGLFIRLCNGGLPHITVLSPSLAQICCTLCVHFLYMDLVCKKRTLKKCQVLTLPGPAFFWVSHGPGGGRFGPSLVYGL